MSGTGQGGAARIMKVTLLAAGGVLVPLALAILGRGGFAAFFGVPALALLVAGTLAMALASGFTGASLSGGLREDRGNRWVLAAFALLTLPFAFLPAWTDRHDLWTIDGEATRWVGLALYLGGGGIRLAAAFGLGARSARSSRSSRGTSWRRVACTALSGIRATRGCSSTYWAGRWPSARRWA